MEHQVFVPVPAADVRALLRDPARVARCVPGLQQDADTDAGPLTGRLKVRVGGHTVTYRGALSVTERDPDHFALTGEGTEVRGNGTVKLSLELRLAETDGGTRLEFTAESAADGRAAAFAPEAAATAAHRLLDRAAGYLAALAVDEPEEATVAPAAPLDTAVEADTGLEADVDADTGLEADVDAAGPDTGPDAAAGLDPVTDADTGPNTGPDGTEVTASVFDTDVPPPSLDPFLEGTSEGMADLGDLGGPPRPPAEAAHARRTMIGRSAEEVDHAPPRGRYAPVPAPTSAAAGAGLRWIVPAAAVAVASAVLLGRALRRRR
ncbi:CoxG family protein [Streptomyces sp. H34-S4]|uniref:CoxG family protein n=1 Tax=Streptomyces sp. H34-S4 TaxID=2996463 RepID=UPI00226E6A5D|nr:SRPBCC domain-containing protein [Streptomyces sp. H34-S4]MCY0933084.1 SRPBCC domain-containing protein [Streptomyces sp. H34-S4]